MVVCYIRRNIHKKTSLWNIIGYIYFFVFFYTVSPYITNDQSPKSEEIKYNDKIVSYSSYVYKAVPPDYKPTEEENKEIEEGSLQIGYGSDKVEEEKTQFLMWQEGDLQYLIMDMGAEIPKDEFVNMAKQVIDMQ